MSSDSDSDWSDVVDNDVNEESAPNSSCLFCDVTLATIDLCMEHMLNNHELNLKELIKRENMDFYKYIKFVNFIRSSKLTVESLLTIKYTDYCDDKWLIPVLANDMMLQVDVDSIIEEANATSDCFDNKLAVAEEKTRLAEEFLERTLEDLNKCRKELNALLLGNTSEPQIVGDKEDDNSGYFSSYAHFGIHEEMLKDKVRTEAYQNFIFGNPGIFSNATVLDVGCGTSVLSMFSAKAGAKQVFGVDYSEVAYQAMDIVKENNLDSVIKIIKAKAEDLNLPVKVNVIISEWMGYFLLFESMMDTVLLCRDSYLADNGCVYPDKCNIQLVALDDSDLYANKIRFWSDVYGFKMNAMKSSVLEEPLVTIVDSSKVISKPYVLKSFDLMTLNTPELDFDVKFQLEMTHSGSVSAIVGYFDIFFERNASSPVSFSTSPCSTPTHWKQTVFFLKEPVEMKSGDYLPGRMFCKKNKKDLRALDIALILFDKQGEILSRQHYVLG